MNANKTASYFDLTGKVCLVTGGSRELGLEMCRAFAAAGANLVISSRKQDACDALLDAAYQEFGQVDVLVNNAGMSPLSGGHIQCLR